MAIILSIVGVTLGAILIVMLSLVAVLCLRRCRRFQGGGEGERRADQTPGEEAGVCHQGTYVVTNESTTCCTGCTGGMLSDTPW